MYTFDTYNPGDGVKSDAMSESARISMKYSGAIIQECHNIIPLVLLRASEWMVAFWYSQRIKNRYLASVSTEDIRYVYFHHQRKTEQKSKKKKLVNQFHKSFPSK